MYHSGGVCVCVYVCVCVCLWVSVCLSVIISLYGRGCFCVCWCDIWGFMGILFYAYLEVSAWLFGHLLFWVSYMHVFCIFVFAPVQRNRACFTWKCALEIRSLLLILLLAYCVSMSGCASLLSAFTLLDIQRSACSLPSTGTACSISALFLYAFICCVCQHSVFIHLSKAACSLCLH